MKSACFTLFLTLTLCTQGFSQEWTVLESSVTEDLYAVYFTDPFNGWAAGDNGTLLHTSDGGETWTRQQSRTTDDLLTLSFFDEYYGWAGGKNSTVIHTSDGGNRWLDRRPSSVPGRDINTVHFNDWKRGWAAGGPDRNIFYTEDTGITWARRGTPEPEITIQVLAVAGITNRNIFAGFDNELEISENHGQEWNRVSFTEDSLFQVQDIFFIDSSRGWAAGFDNGNSYILSTMDGGSSWDLNLTFPDETIIAVQFLDETHGRAVSREGTLLQTRNGGVDWISSEASFLDSINSAHFVKTGTGWVAGNNGLIARFDDPETEQKMLAGITPPRIRLSNEAEAIDLLNHALKYGETAREFETIERRKPNYERLRIAVQNVQQFYSGSRIPARISDRIRDLPGSYWSHEHNEGVRLYNLFTEENNNETALTQSIHHFENAIAVLPDSAISHISLAVALENKNEYQRAALTVKRGIDIMTEPKPEHYDYLIQLFLQIRDYEKALQAAENAAEKFTYNRVFLEYLTDLNFEAGNTEDALEYLSRLIDLDPSNTTYRFARGSQVFQSAYQLLEESLQYHEALWEANEQLIGIDTIEEEQRLTSEVMDLEREINRYNIEAERLKRQAIRDIEIVTENNPEDDSAYAYLGYIYTSRAVILEEIHLLTPDDDKALTISRKITQYLQFAVEKYRKAAELNPSHREYSEILIRIYMQLGMDREASELRDMQ
jgi:photosystem II stability/assembly factor-like uncharacterized protein/tetratricopeptide (TPR) repeat protein